MLYYKSKTSTHKVQQAMLCYTKYLKPVPQCTKGHVISHCISNQYHNVPKAMLYHAYLKPVPIKYNRPHANKKHLHT